MSLSSERCSIVASWQSQHLSVKKKQKNEKKTFLMSAWRGYDQTQLRSKSPLIRPKCARRGYDQTQLRSKLPLIRPKCARICLWSDFSDQIDFWSDHLQTIDQTVKRSNIRPDPVISVWELTGVRSTGCDHIPIWVWTSTWVPMIRLSCVEIHLCPEYRVFKVVYIHTIVHSNIPMSRFLRVLSCFQTL